MNTQKIDATLLWVIPLGITPNQITSARVFLGILSMYLYIQGGVWVALVVFAVAATTDYLDGLIARARDLSSSFGKRFDELADKFLVIGFLCIFFLETVLIEYLESGIGFVEISAIMLIILREVYMTVVRSLGRITSTQVLLSAKLKTSIQMTAISFLIVGQEYWVLETAGVLLLMIGAILGVRSAYLYIYGT